MKTGIIPHCWLRSRLSATQPGMWTKDRAPGQPQRSQGTEPGDKHGHPLSHSQERGSGQGSCRFTGGPGASASAACSVAPLPSCSHTSWPARAAALGVLGSMWYFLFIHPLPISLSIHGSQRVCNFLIKTTMTYGPVFCSRSPLSGELVINADKSAADAKTKHQQRRLFL